MTEGTQRRQKARKPSDSRVVRLQLKDGMGNPRWVTADLLDGSDGGLGVSLISPIPSGSIVVIRGGCANAPSEGERPGRVKWCVERPDGAFRLGIEFIERSAGNTESQTAKASKHPKDVDYYEFLQLSPNADSETVGRVYRLLAQRYHPDNPVTGSGEIFVGLSEAYSVISDPVQRAKYDAVYRENKKLQWKIFDNARDTIGLEAERRKRRGILAMLHQKTLHDPELANVTVFELEELLACPREHLQAALWYLRAKGYIQRADNGRYTITVDGFDEAEENAPAGVQRFAALGAGGVESDTEKPADRRKP
jgi:hypothetical protein